jgi:LuxR family transcriptional regulator, glucitol operon activator
VAVLTHDEAAKAAARLERREGVSVDAADHRSLLPGLDLGEKYAVLMRHRSLMDQASREYYLSQQGSFEKAIPVRNAVMHGRPLTTTEFALGMSIANELVSAPRIWPNLTAALRRYNNGAKLAGDFAREFRRNLQNLRHIRSGKSP